MHGISFSLWVLLYGVQAALISSKYQKLHRKLGLFGGLILATVFLTGFYTTFLFPLANKFQSTLYLSTTVALAIIGLITRGNLFQHKRYIFYATLAMSSAGISRATDILSGFGVDKLCIIIRIRFTLHASRSVANL